MRDPAPAARNPSAGAYGRRSLRLELLFTLAVVLVMAVLSLSFLNEFLAQRRHERAELDRVERYTEALAIRAAREFRGPTTFDPAALRDLLQSEMAGQVDLIAIELLGPGPQGPRPITSVGAFDPLEAPARLPERAHARWLEATGVVVAEAPLPIHGDGLPSPMLRVVAAPTPWLGPQSWRGTLTVAAGVAVVLLVFGGALIELQIARPLRAVREGAARVAQGELDVSVPTDGPAEFSALARDFNRMTESLRAQLDTVATQRDQLQRSEQLAAVGRVAAGVAHEIGNPLAAIHGYIEFLLDPRTGLPQAERELLERMSTQTERIQGIVAQLLDYTRAREATTEPTALRDAAAEMLELVRGDPRWAEVSVELVGPRELRALSDRGWLHQILLNLGLNAMRAASEGEGPTPRVQIRVGQGADGRPWIEVQDNGPGVAEEARARLFEPFFTTRAAGDGTGLGLAVSQGLAERMGGSLRCLPADARAPLRDGDRPGAVFRLELRGVSGGRSDDARGAAPDPTASPRRPAGRAP